MKEFQRLIKPDGFLSVLKHNTNGRIMQMVVLLDEFKHANDLIDGKAGASSKYGVINYYGDEDLVRWSPEFKIDKVLGMRTFWDLQQNQEKHRDKCWQEKMINMELRVSVIQEFQNVAFFHHVLLVKR